MVYVLLMVLLTPVLLLGFPFYQIPILLRRGKVSGTAYEPFNARLLYHLMGSRPDPATRQLAAGLPATNRAFMALLVWPLVLASKLSGYHPAFLAYPPRRPGGVSGMIGDRCEFLDAALLDHAPRVAQVVILGAGWDTRAYGLLRGQDVAIFEVDAPATQAVKRAALDKTGLDASHVTFVACDLNEKSWLDALTEHGFDPEKTTFLLWEGVTMYLEERAIERTLRAVSTLPPGSCIAFDFFRGELLASFVGKLFKWSGAAIYGEPLRFGFSGRLGETLEQYGLHLDRDREMGNRWIRLGGLALAMKRG